MIDAGVEAGATDLQALRFGLADDGPIRRQALQQAAREVRAKAEAIAGAVGVSLGELLEVNEASPGIIPVRDFAVAGEALRAAPTPVEPGELTIRAMVTVRYRIASEGASGSRAIRASARADSFEPLADLLKLLFVKPFLDRAGGRRRKLPRAQ